jgi:hypothetical protein
MNTFLSLKILPLHLLLLITWVPSGLSKLFSPGVPEGFATTFGPTFLGQFPGLFVSFYSIAVLETLAALLALVSLARGEFLPGRAKNWLKACLILSLFIFAQLGFGNRLVNDYSSAASLFFYFGATLVMLFYVEFTEKQAA